MVSQANLDSKTVPRVKSKNRRVAATAMGSEHPSDFSLIVLAVHGQRPNRPLRASAPLKSIY